MTLHADDNAVSLLSMAMTTKLRKMRTKGRAGWDSESCSQQHLSNLLRAAVEKGDTVDVANYCAFLLARVESILPAEQPKPVASGGWMEQLGFEVRQYDDMLRIVVDDCGNEREATLTERVLWDALMAASAEFAEAPQAPAAPVLQLPAARAGRIYVAGPMTGLPDHNFPAFNAAAAALRANGWHVENPAEHGIVEGAEWADYLHYDMGRLATCSAVHLLPGWSKSRGAALEVHVATTLGMPIFYADGAEPVGAAPAAPAVDALGERDAAFEAVRKRLCGLQRYSFVLDDDGVVRRAQDRTGNWIEFDDAHALFDPVAVDAARAAQAKEGGEAC